MVELICERELCRYCLYDKCENEQIKKEFQDLQLVSKVLLSVSSDSCSKYDEDESLIDPQS